MPTLTVEQKYADPAVVNFWQNLAREGLQKAEQSMIQRYLPPTGHLLDVGCGTGRALLAMVSLGYRVTGIDLSLPMLSAGRGLAANAQFSAANLLNLPFTNRSFSAAFMFFGALQHIQGHNERRQALAELGRIVEPEGILILGLDNLAPTLSMYFYWLKQKFRLSPKTNGSHFLELEHQIVKPLFRERADKVLWQRRTNPIVWHYRGVLRALRWRTWPGMVDRYRSLYGPTGGLQTGDVNVAQFSQPATPGQIYYHIYQAGEMIDDATTTGWQLLGWHCGSELAAGEVYPARIRAMDKQLFFAFRAK